MAGDIASFSNVSVEEALDALRSGLTGEFEPLKRLGGAFNVSLLEAKALTEGLLDQDGVFSNRERTLAFQAALFDQFSDAVGDAGNTQDTAAGKSRVLAGQLDNLETKLGEAIVPLKQLGLELAIGLVEGLNAVGEALGRVNTQELIPIRNTFEEVDEATGVTTAQLLMLSSALQVSEEQAVPFAQAMNAINAGMDYADGIFKLVTQGLYNEAAASSVAETATFDLATAIGAANSELGLAQLATTDYSTVTKSATVLTEELRSAFVDMGQSMLTEMPKLKAAFAESDANIRESSNLITSLFGGSGPARQAIKAFWAQNAQDLKNARYFLNPQTVNAELRKIRQGLKDWKAFRAKAQREGNQKAVELANQHIAKLKLLRYGYKQTAQAWWSTLSKETRAQLTRYKNMVLARIYAIRDALKLIMLKAGFSVNVNTSTSSASTRSASAGTTVVVNNYGDPVAMEQSVMSAISRATHDNGGMRLSPYNRPIRG